MCVMERGRVQLDGKTTWDYGSCRVNGAGALTNDVGCSSVLARPGPASVNRGQQHLAPTSRVIVTLLRTAAPWWIDRDHRVITQVAVNN